MERSLIYAVFAGIVMCHYGKSGLAADNVEQCRKLFKELASIATCNTISSMRGGALSDEELREIVSRQIYSAKPEEVEREALQKELERRKAEAESEATQKKSNQCYRLFVDPSEHESCRILRMLSISERSDDEMRQAVKERLAREQREEEQRKTALEAEKKRRVVAVEAERRRKNEVDAKLKKGPIGFTLNRWELGGFGRVMIVQFTLQNNTGIPQKDFVISCRTHGNSGTQLDAPRGTLYERLGAGVKQSFELNMGIVNSQSARVSCNLLEWTAS
jgi:hypothetical protein